MVPRVVSRKTKQDCSGLADTFEREERIRFAVRMGYKGELVDTRVNDGNEEPPELDGY